MAKNMLVFCPNNYQLLEEVPLETRLQIWYQHDGCLAHNARVARVVSREIFPKRWISREETSIGLHVLLIEIL